MVSPRSSSHISLAVPAIAWRSSSMRAKSRAWPKALCEWRAETCQGARCGSQPWGCQTYQCWPDHLLNVEPSTVRISSRLSSLMTRVACGALMSKS